MAQNVGGYSVSLGLDASQFASGANLTKRQLRELDREFQKARTPAEKLERKLEQFNEKMRRFGMEGTKEAAEGARRLREQIEKLSKTDTMMNRFTKSLGSMTKGFLALAAAQLSIRGVTSAVQSLRDTLLEVDALAKRARGLNVAFGDLQAVQLAASEVAGVSPEQTAEVMAKLTKQVGNAAIGMKEVQKTFQRLNLDVANLQKMSPAEQFFKITEALRQVRDPAERMALAVKLGEAEFKKFMPLIDDATVSLEGYRQVVRDLGLDLSESTIKNIEAANDEIGRMALEWKAVKMEFAADEGVIRAMRGFTDFLSESAKKWAHDIGLFMDGLDLIEARMTGRKSRGEQMLEDTIKRGESEAKFREEQIAKRRAQEARNAASPFAGMDLAGGIGGAISDAFGAGKSKAGGLFGMLSDMSDSVDKWAVDTKQSMLASNRAQLAVAQAELKSLEGGGQTAVARTIQKGTQAAFEAMMGIDPETREAKRAAHEKKVEALQEQSRFLLQQIKDLINPVRKAR